MIILEVLISVPINKSFYYLPLKNIDPVSIVGKRVKVFFGNRIVVAYVISFKELNDKVLFFKLKSIIEVLDNCSFITNEVIDLAKYISKNYICSLGEALATILPNSIKQSKKNKKQKDKDIVICEKKKKLNVQQNNAINIINNFLNREKYFSFLIHGVTASGKTEVYMNVIENVLKKNKAVIMLIPEISLTPQFLLIMTKRFGLDVGVWHSNISNSEKYDLLLKTKTNKKKIIIGTRSAIFVPFQNIGLIIVDEEHEKTYKQEQKPSYDARDIAKWRAIYHNAIVIFGSATPSIESYKDSIDNKLKLIELSERVNKKQFPEIKLIKFINNKNKTSLLLSETINEISKALIKKEQIIIFLNRKGYSPIIICEQCKNIYKCINCSISMVFHKNPDILKCHYCGIIKRFPITCYKCNCKKVVVFGIGIQRVEQELKSIFKFAKILRLDGDIVYKKNEYEKIYNKIKNCEYDILLGTQIITTGFDFKDVNLVCVVDADMSLNYPDFRSVERTFQLITQVAGRSGRGNSRGVVMIQTNNPTHYAIKCIVNNDFLSFYNTEIKFREKLFYPPYCDIAKILIKNRNIKKINIESEKLFCFLSNIIKEYKLNLKLLGPISAYVFKLNNLYRKNIIIKGKKEDILAMFEYFNNLKKISSSLINIEIMPLSLL
jgi:primosomal protein N' (replication factor Y)